MNVTDNIIVKTDALLLVRMEPTLKAKLLAHSEELEISAAAIIRSLLHEYFSAREKNGKKR